MWGLVISAATIIASTILAEERKDSKPSSTRSSETRTTREAVAIERRESNHVSSLSEGDSSLMRRDTIFLSGTLLGSGLVILFTALSHQYRVPQRLRLLVHSLWLAIEKKTPSDAPFRKPAPPEASKDLLYEGDYGSIRLLASPKTAPTSQLHVSMITLLPGAELPSYTAQAVEFYHVLQGAGGTFSQHAMQQEMELTKGDCFIVDPGSLRWISNSNGKEPLVLLRSTDGGDRLSGKELDAIIRRDPNYRTLYESAYESLTESFRGISNGGFHV